MSAKIRNAPALFRPLSTSETVAIRLHQIVLYNSIYGADDQLMVNQRIYDISSSRTVLLCFASLRAAIWWILTLPASNEPGWLLHRSREHNHLTYDILAGMAVHGLLTPRPLTRGQHMRGRWKFAVWPLYHARA